MFFFGIIVFFNLSALGGKELLTTKSTKKLHNGHKKKNIVRVLNIGHNMRSIGH